VNIYKKIILDLNIKLKKVDKITRNDEWWKNEFIYIKYIQNKNLKWWEKEFILNRFNF
jgi:hypothetical protein